MKIYNQAQVIENLKKCSHYYTCSQNLCPLDLELYLRSGGNQDKCRWMREAKTSKIAGREFVSGGATIPNAILNFVPSENLRYLNEASQAMRQELNKN
jgi:hypothetical protein